MDKISLKILDKNDKILAEETGLDQINLFYRGEYNDGERIILTAPREKRYLVIRLDDALDETLVYMARADYEFTIPFGEKRISYNPKSFSGGKHLLTARMAEPFEISAYRNVAKNVYDAHGNESCFPHAYANVETRNESVFAARNAIDGNSANRGHGEWPFESWGINKNPGAEMTVDFGRAVEVDKIVLHTRADFPHDNWWTSADLAFSDGSVMTVPMEKSYEPHVFCFPLKKTERIRLRNLIKCASDPSEFPALSQIEAYGKDINA